MARFLHNQIPRCVMHPGQHVDVGDTFQSCQARAVRFIDEKRGGLTALTRGAHVPGAVLTLDPGRQDTADEHHVAIRWLSGRILLQQLLAATPLEHRSFLRAKGLRHFLFAERHSQLRRVRI